MLTIFNRTVVYATYSEENLEKVKGVLNKENVEFLVRTTKSEFGYDELGTAFKIYVHQEDADTAQRLINETLFPVEK